MVHSSASPEGVDDDPDPRVLTTRREEAFTLYCQGYRSPAIASLLGVPQRTVRAWIAATLKDAAEESRTRRDQQLRLAIESQRAIVHAAWQAFDRAARTERLTLEHLQNAVPLNVDDDDDDLAADLDASGGSPSPPQRRGGQGVRTLLPHLPHLPTVGARYLQIVLHAQREIARLSGLYDLPASVHDPNAEAEAGRPMQIVIRRDPNLPREQLVAWTAFRAQWDAAHPDHPVLPDDLVFPPFDGDPHHDFTAADDDDPDDADNPDDFDDLDFHAGSAYSDDRSTAGDRGHTSDAAPAATPPDFSPSVPCASSSEPQSRVTPCAGPDESAPLVGDQLADLQPAQAGFVAERPLGADSSAGPPESPAETANPDPATLVPDAIAPPSPEPSDGVPATVPPALLPHFRYRGHLGRPSLLRQGFGPPR